MYYNNDIYSNNNVYNDNNVYSDDDDDVYSDDEIETILELIDIYYNETAHLQYISDYKNILLNDIKDLLLYDDYIEDIDELIEMQIDYYFYVNDIPEYSLFYYEINNDNNDNFCSFNDNNFLLTDKITKLINIPIVEQRTNEWLELRHNMLSASNIYRAFKSPSTISSLINDKSIPLINMPNYNSKGGIYNPMAWGILFEKVSVSLYEFIYNTKVSLFGCIKHPTFDFIGASPDGINTSLGERFGRMLEIKNIYNRDITGIPTDEYWVQMQIQMEVCDLPLCDFLETRFCLYSSMEDFYKDDCDFKGVIIDIDGNNNYNYYYLWDYNGDVNNFMSVINIEILKYNNYFIHWWFLDEFSCVLIKRNKSWFNAIFPFLQKTWNMIIDARQQNNNNFCFNKKTKNNKICLIKLDEKI